MKCKNCGHKAGYTYTDDIFLHHKVVGNDDWYAVDCYTKGCKCFKPKPEMEVEE